MSVVRDGNTSPLPPGWESRFDSKTQRWYFVNHAGKTTTWQDPRMNKHSVTPQVASSGVKCRRPSSQSGSRKTSHSESAYTYVDSLDDRENAPMSRRSTVHTTTNVQDENEEDETYANYLTALRAAYPECNAQQLARLLEEYLGESPELRNFISTNLVRLPSGYNEPRSSTKQTNKPPIRRSTESKGSSGTALPTQAEHKAPKPEPTRGPIVNSNQVDSSQNIQDQTSTNTSGDIATTVGTLRNMDINLDLQKRTTDWETPDVSKFMRRTSDSTLSAPKSDRVVPIGPDQSLLTQRIHPCGPDSKLVSGPDPTNVHGSMKNYTISTA